MRLAVEEKPCRRREHEQHARANEGASSPRKGRGRAICRRIDEQPVSRARDAFDDEGAGGGLRGDPPDHRDRAVEAVIADVHPAPAFVVQVISGDDLALRVDEREEDLHRQRLDVDLAGGSFDQAQGGAHLKRAE